MAILGAGCFLLLNRYLFVAERSDCLGFCLLANRASKGLYAVFFTGGLGGNLAIVPSVAGSFDCLSFGFLANRAGIGLYAVCFTGGFGSNHALVPSVSSGWDCLGFGFLANRASIGLYAVFFTGGFGGNHALAPSVTKRIDLFAVFHYLAAVCADGIAGIAFVNASGILLALELGMLMSACNSIPYAIFIGNCALVGKGCRFRIAAVSIAELCGGQRNLMLGNARAALGVLISHRLRTGSGSIDLASPIRANVCTARGGINSAVCRQLAVHRNGSIQQVCIGTAIGLAGCIPYRNVFARAGIGICRPLIGIVNIEAVALRNRQLSTFCNVYLNASQQCSGLVHGHLAALGQVDRHVVGQGQNIVCRADTYTP